MIEVKERPKARAESMTLQIRKIGVIGAGQMGNGIAHVCALAGFDVLLNDISPDRIKAGIATINGNMARQVSRKRITEEERQAALQRIAPAEKYEAFDDCDLVIEAATEKEDVKRTIFASVCPVLKPEAILGTNTSSISITRLAVLDRPAGAIHRHPLHESGAADGAGRAHPRHRHRRSDLRVHQAVRDQARQDHRGGRGFPGLHRQPHSAADDQRGDLHALRRRRQRRGDRHRHAARRASSDGAARACRLHRARHLPVGHAGAARGAGQFQVPPVPAAGEIRRGRLARPQDPARLLRLSRREAGADADDGRQRTEGLSSGQLYAPSVSVYCRLRSCRSGNRRRRRLPPGRQRRHALEPIRTCA